MKFEISEAPKMSRFIPDFADGRPCIRDTQQHRTAFFREASSVQIVLDAIELKGVDPEHIDWLPDNYSQPELAINPS
jgi:hypothetical protein